MDYSALLIQECPAFIAEHVRQADIYTANSLFWPEGYTFPNDFPPQCMVAMLGATTPKMHPDAPPRRLSSYFFFALIFAEHLPDALIQDIKQVAKTLPISQDLTLSYFEALRALKIDVRDAIAPQFLDAPADEPLTEFNRSDRYYQYMLYRSVLGDRDALRWMNRLIDRLVYPDDIISVHEALKQNDVPGWQDILKRSFNDTRQSMGVSGCGGFIVGEHAQMAVGITTELKRLKGIVVYKPGQTKPKSCDFDR